MININKKGFALIIAMFLMIISGLLALFLLEYIIPFSRNTKGMENGTKAYYQANQGIENVLFSMKGKDAYFETGNTNNNGNIGHYYTLSSTGNTIPIPGDGTSEYNYDYNKISISNPVQLLMKGPIDWGLVNFYFKVPDLDESGTNISISGALDQAIINWQLSSNSGTLNSSGTHIIANDIGKSNNIPPGIQFGGRIGKTLEGTNPTFKDFYDDPINNCISSGCSLKLSVITNLETDNNSIIPYLEYKIEFPSGPSDPKIANYYSIIRSSGKSTGYRKDLKLYIPQQTTIEAFDFTVFQ